MESKFVVLVKMGKKAKCLRDLLLEILFTSKSVSLILIHYNSQATLARAYNDIYSEKSRNISL